MRTVACMAGLLAFTPAWSQVVTLENVTLGAQNYYNGADDAGGFTSGGAFFPNSHFGTPPNDYWSGWSASAATDQTTAGYTNQYSAKASPAGGDNSVKYAVAFDTTSLTLPAGTRPTSLRMTNTVYAYLSMHDGDGFAKKFGGVSGNDPDYFRVTITGKNGVATTGSLDYYLADFRFANNALDYIRDNWATVDLTPLGNARSLEFTFASSDVGDFGINTPTYFALDNLQVTPVPEPGTLLLTVSAALLVWRRSVRGDRDP